MGVISGFGRCIKPQLACPKEHLQAGLIVSPMEGDNLAAAICSELQRTSMSTPLRLLASRSPSFIWTRDRTRFW